MFLHGIPEPLGDLHPCFLKKLRWQFSAGKNVDEVVFQGDLLPFFIGCKKDSVVLDPNQVGIKHRHEQLFFDRLGDLFPVLGFDAAEFIFPVRQHHLVLLRQQQGRFDC